jgi:hypothetical protein
VTKANESVAARKWNAASLRVLFEFSKNCSNLLRPFLSLSPSLCSSIYFSTYPSANLRKTERGAARIITSNRRDSVPPCELMEKLNSRDSFARNINHTYVNGTHYQLCTHLFYDRGIHRDLSSLATKPARRTVNY